MRNHYHVLSLSLQVFLFIFIAIGCGKKDTPTPAAPAPTITALSSPVAGIGYPLVITGNNFDTVATENKVSVNGVSATVITATSVKLTITIPDAATSGKIMVTVKGQSATSQGDIKIVKLTVTTLAGSGVHGSADGSGSTASFNGFWEVVTDNNGNIFVADAFNNKIRKITPSGDVTTYAGTGMYSGAGGTVNGTAATSTFGSPFGITIDKAQNLYVADLGYSDIRKIDSTGMVTTLAGGQYGESGAADGTGNAARFNNPLGIEADENANIYVADAGNSKIRKITPAGTVTTFAGSGTPGSADGTGTAASFNTPFALALDANDNLFVTDALNFKIRKITPAGVVTTFAGSGATGNADGQGAAAAFKQPAGIVVDATGNLYVTDSENGNIRLITPDGFAATVAGNGTQESVDGTGYSASFSNPLGITIDKNGIMYVLDNGGSKVRKITIQ